MSRFNLHDFMVLAGVPGVGHQRLRTLIDKFGTPTTVLGAHFAHLESTAGIDRTTAREIVDRADRANSFAEEQLQRMALHGAQLITYWDDAYPERLRQIHDAPAYLFARGSLSSADERAVAIVGTRRCTPYGKLMAERLASELAVRGITVVSGLARGIDTAAHEAALRTGGRTLAVLGSGADHIYPAENGKLASAVIEQGAILSDYPMGTGPDAVNFPNRNRIISGLSLGAVIVEAPIKSGAMITARFALDQNREVFAVPGHANAEAAQGPHALIKNGAKLVESVDDIVEELLLLQSVAPVERMPSSFQLNFEQQMVYDCLSASPTHVDDVSVAVKMPVTEALSVLLALEMQGAVRQLSGKQFIRI